MPDIPIITKTEVLEAEEIVPGKEYKVRPGVHLVLSKYTAGGALCMDCVTRKNVEGVTCLSSLNGKFVRCTEDNSYYWGLKLGPEVGASPPPIQPSLF